MRHDPRDLGAQVYFAIAKRSIATEPNSITGAIGWFLRKASGNVSLAARLAGVPRRSMRDYAAGKSVPKGDRAAAMLQSAKVSERRARLGPRREKKLRQPVEDSYDIQITGSYNYDGSSENRAPIMISDYMDPDAGNQLVDAYLSGAGPDELRELFADLIVDAPFYANTLRLPHTDVNGWSIANVTM